MSASPAASLRHCNRLLAMLSELEFDELAPYMQSVRLNVRDLLGEPGKPVSQVYFPCTSVLSVLASMANGEAVEVGTVGNEGFCGIELLMGGSQWTEITVCQVAGDCLCMPAAAYRDAIGSDTPLRRLTQRYTLFYLGLVSQSAACNRLHTIEERFARWILMTHDRVQGDEFYLTQEFIADMLGVHRPSVSVVAGMFQQAGFIHYSRGHMQIRNRSGLEEASCECYAASEQQIARLLQAPR